MQVCTLVSAHHLIGVDPMHSTQILISGFSSQERTGQARPPVVARGAAVRGALLLLGLSTARSEDS